ncbi:MAG: pyridoxal phosphate-dependent aminotransferase [Candidatus Eiseniibacteriota bacterium]
MNDRPRAAGAATRGYLRPRFSGLPAFRAPAIGTDAAGNKLAQPPRRLNLNESAEPPSPRVVEAVRRAADALNRYPDPMARKLALALAERTGVAAERIVFGNGSDELIGLSLAVALDAGDSAVLPTPSFGRYLVATSVLGAEPRQIPVTAEGANDIDAMLAAIDTTTRAVVVASPNNPTGALVETAALVRLIAGVPDDCLLIIDDAYHEFARAAGAADPLDLLKTRKGGWVVLRTLSKAYSLAGLRIGYALTSADDIPNALNLVRGTFNVNVLAQAAALAALDDEDHVRAAVARCIAERERLSAGLAKLGLSVLPSAANFVSVALPLPAPQTVAHLAEAGILAGGVGGPPFERHVRFTIGTAQDNDAVLAAVARLIAG